MKHFRFSLLTALLIVAIVALSVTVVMLSRENRRSRNTVRDLSVEVGKLVISDATKPHVMSERLTGEFAWKWRLWIPKDSKYSLNFRVRQIPSSNFPTNVTSLKGMPPGESWVEYRIEPGAAPKKWADRLSTPIYNVSSEPEELEWMNSRTGVSGKNVGYGTDVKEPHERIQLMRYRVSEKGRSSTNIEDPSGGFIIWLEPEK